MRRYVLGAVQSEYVFIILVWCFGVLYFIGTTLVVCCYNNESQICGTMRLQSHTINDFFGVKNIC